MLLAGYTNTLENEIHLWGLQPLIQISMKDLLQKVGFWFRVRVDS